MFPWPPGMTLTPLKSRLSMLQWKPVPEKLQSGKQEVQHTGLQLHEGDWSLWRTGCCPSGWSWTVKQREFEMVLKVLSTSIKFWGKESISLSYYTLTRKFSSIKDMCRCSQIWMNSRTLAAMALLEKTIQLQTQSTTITKSKWKIHRQRTSSICNARGKKEVKLTISWGKKVSQDFNVQQAIDWV